MAVDYFAILHNKGFYCWKKCVCNGVREHKFLPKNQRIILDVRIFPDFKSFQINKNYRLAARGTNLSNLETTLTNLMQ